MPLTASGVLDLLKVQYLFQILPDILGSKLYTGNILMSLSVPVPGFWAVGHRAGLPRGIVPCNGGLFVMPNAGMVMALVCGCPRVSSVLSQLLRRANNFGPELKETAKYWTWYTDFLK